MRNRSLAWLLDVRWWIVALLGLSAFANPQASYAHPMGNFSISHYTGIRVEPTYIELRYIIDMAEIPTYQEMQDTGIFAHEGSAGLDAYLARRADLLARGLVLEVDGHLLPLRPVSQSVIFPPGAGGLPTMKLGFVYRAALGNLTQGSSYIVHYRDDNFPGRAGWKEIVVPNQPGFTLTVSSALQTDRSGELSNYPTDLLNSPPQAVEASFSFSPIAMKAAAPLPEAAPRISTSSAISAKADDRAGRRVSAPGSLVAKSSTAVRTDPPAAIKAPDAEVSKASAPPAESSAIPLALRANQIATPRSRFTELISARNPGFWFLFTAALLAAGLGALHALEPGHGKTIVAAYLVGSKGTARHAIWLGVIVTLAHTAGVYLLGALTLYASRYIVPEQLFPWLEILSGLIIAVVAGFLIIRAWTGESGEHSHDAGASHSHWFASLSRPGKIRALQGSAVTDVKISSSIALMDVPSATPARTVSLTQLLSLGISGGIVPCPAALVVLLSALSLHRVGFGLFLIVAFSLGLAAVLIASGLLMVYAKQVLARWKTDGPFVKRWLPLASGMFMLILGLSIAGRATVKTAAVTSLFAHGTLPSFVGVVLLGLFLGMRHSTDPDHVIAVSTIASRERSVSQGALIGVLWGVGHTLTIFVVGSAIILFGLVIPPRVGLSMEFSVALMLILLGVLNLTGALRWLNSRFSPSRNGPLPSELPTSGNAPEGALDRLLNRYGAYQVFRPLVIGLVHGLAGSAAVALLVLSTIHTPLWAIAYLLVFGIGTIIGMMLMTSAMAIPVVYTGKHFSTVNRYLTPISGIVSTAFGLVLLYQIGIVDGLFRSHVHWTPQ
jgi:ABC-type nickel/cobalt efflux system permease component RcnA